MATILSVTELTRHIRDILESRLGEVWVEGEWDHDVPVVG